MDDKALPKAKQAPFKVELTVLVVGLAENLAKRHQYGDYQGSDCCFSGWKASLKVH